MTVAVTYASTMTIEETLDNNVDSIPASTRKVTHTAFNIAASLNAGSSPPAVKTAEFLATLVAGALTIDLRALVGTNGAIVDGNGLKVQVVRIKNLGANPMTFKVGAANGHTGVIPATPGVVVQPGGHVVLYSNDNGDDVDATHKTWDVTGTGAQQAQVSILLG